jgi:nicotinate phosphoribosyltransferase
MKQIVATLADTDLYKLTMLLFAFEHCPETQVRYELSVRSDVVFTAEDEAEIKRQLKLAGEACFDQQSLDWLAQKSPFLSPQFLTYLKGVRLDPRQVYIWRDQEGHLQGIVEGLWTDTILWEIIVLAVTSEVYFAHRFPPLTEQQKLRVYEDAKAKGQGFRERKCYFIEMGTRRRYSLEVQRLVMRGLVDGATDPKTGKSYLLGSSNVMLAAEFGIVPQGTMAHEIFSVMAAIAGVENANNLVLGKWSETYHGSLGIALPDTFTTSFFLRTFNPFYARLFDGVRHDSDPDPIGWARLVIDHYAKLGIDPKTKRFVFSDGIDSWQRVDSILSELGGTVMVSFGIGTWLTNDLRHINDASALNIVMKAVAARKNRYEPWRHAVKLSDVAGKHIGDPATIEEYMRKVPAVGYGSVTPLDQVVPAGSQCG